MKNLNENMNTRSKENILKPLSRLVEPQTSYRAYQIQEHARSRKRLCGTTRELQGLQVTAHDSWPSNGQGLQGTAQKMNKECERKETMKI